MPLLTIHRIHVKFQGSDTRWPVDPTFSEDGHAMYLCPHATICGNYTAYHSSSGLHRHTRAHAPDTKLSLPMSKKPLGNMTSSLTPHPQLHPLAEVDLQCLPANGHGADGLGAMTLNLSPSLAGFQTDPQPPIHPVQAVSTHSSIGSLLLNTISG